MTKSPKISASLVTTLALLSALGPFAIDMYLPAFPRMLDELDTSAAAVQLTLTSFMLGMALGQLVVGPFSDQVGRRKLLIIGSVVCTAASVFCAIAPNIEILIGARFVQGLTGAAGVVLARAVVTDTVRGAHAAKLFSIMMAVGGIAPVLAPLAGGGIIVMAGWRGVFWALALLNLLMVVGSILFVKESLPKELRSNGGLRGAARNMNRVLSNRRFVGFTLTFVCSMAAMFAYISASPFVLQNILGLNTTTFSIAFAANALGLTCMSLTSARLVGKFGPKRLAAIGVSALVTCSAALLGVITLGDMPLVPTLLLLFGAISSLGLIYGNATALAIEQVRERAGSGSAIIGALQFALAAIASPLVGLAGEHSALPMGVVMLTASVLALFSLTALTRGSSAAPAS